MLGGRESELCPEVNDSRNSFNGIGSQEMQYQETIFVKEVTINVKMEIENDRDNQRGRGRNPFRELSALKGRK